jgi:hypothetical protein
VLHGSLQTLHYHFIDMHKLTPKIQEAIAFTNWLSDKQIQQKRAKSEIWVTLAIFGPLEQLFPQLQIFMKICTHVDHDIRNNFSILRGD